MTDREQEAFDRHTEDGFRCTDPSCMFPVSDMFYTWCTRKRR